jgi:type IV secretion system protein VirB8
MSEKTSSLEQQKALENLPIILLRVIFVLAFLLIVAIVGITLLFPLKEKEVFFVEFKTSQENYVVVKKANQTILSNRALIHSELEGYVVARETINQTDENRRYKNIVRVKSSQKVYEQFLNTFRSNKDMWNIEGFKRSCKINSINDVLYDTKTNNYVAIVEYSLTDTFTTGTPEVRSYKATLQYRFVDQNINLEDLTLNPIGTEIIEYSIAPLINLEKEK